MLLQMYKVDWCAGSDGPVFWAQAQTSDAAKICDASPAKVLRRLKVQLQVASGTQLSAPALYGLGGGQHSVSAYLQKHCAPSPAFSRAEILAELAALHQQSLHSQWCALKQADGSLHIHLSRDACLLRVRLEDGLMYTDLMVRGAFQSLDLSFMGVPKQLSSQAGLREVLPLLERAHICAGASAACNGKYDSILLGDEYRPYVNQQGQVCGHEEMQAILTRDGLFRYTVRSTACSRLVPQGTLLCKPCKHLQRSQLDSRLRRAQNRQQADQKSSRARPRTETYEQAAKRAKEAQAELRNRLRREARLRRKVAEMESGLQSIRKATNEMQAEFRPVGKATNDDLLQLFEAAQNTDNNTGMLAMAACYICQDTCPD